MALASCVVSRCDLSEVLYVYVVLSLLLLPIYARTLLSLKIGRSSRGTLSGILPLLETVIAHGKHLASERLGHDGLP